jgi:hypothetical protein
MKTQLEIGMKNVLSPTNFETWQRNMEKESRRMETWQMKCKNNYAR